ncbi:tagaturonate reductase [Haloferula chungangensis]|uniref:Tagaturonate reductase n=1 Tax=Haloferula chungangensis TaxID=1048331 RepID=A0ABW2LD19_9BACT
MKALNRSTAGDLPNYPERVIQFGEGNFLRAFVDWMIQRMNQTVDFNSSVAIVQPIEQGLADLINKQDGLYHLVLEGMKDGQVVKESELIHCVTRCLNPHTQFQEYRGLFESPDVRFVVSNTTEAGIQWADGESLDMEPQHSFPGKMTALLYRRFQKYDGAADKGLIIICCELIEDNADKLKEYVLRHAANWKLEQTFIDWLENACAFCSTLVDRIVPGFPRDTVKTYQEQFGFEDNLIVVGEYYHNWVIKAPEWVAKEFPADQAGLNVSFVDEAEQRKIRDQKVRILNGSHTGTMAVAYLSGFDTVRESMENEHLGKFVRQMLAEDIVPNIPGDQDYLQQFSDKILERFYNPFIRHGWLTISLNSMSKWETRVLPSLLDAKRNTGRVPDKLAFSLAALIAFYAGQRAEEMYVCRDNQDILDLYQRVWSSYDSSPEGLHKLVETVLAYKANWKMNLNEVDGLTDAVTSRLARILEIGVFEAMKETLS